MNWFAFIGIGIASILQVISGFLPDHIQAPSTFHITSSARLVAHSPVMPKAVLRAAPLTPTGSTSTGAIAQPVRVPYEIDHSGAYWNAEYEFEIQVPNDLVMTSNPTAAQTQGNNPYILGSFDDDSILFPLVAFSKGDTNSIFTDLIVLIGTTSNALTGCLNPPASSDYLSYSRVSSTTINGVHFSTFDGVLDIGKAGLSGVSFGARYYRTIKNDICYGVEIQDSGSGFSPAPGVDKTTAQQEAAEFNMPFDAWDAFEQLDAAAHSLRFIGNTASAK